MITSIKRGVAVEPLQVLLSVFVVCENLFPEPDPLLRVAQVFFGAAIVWRPALGVAREYQMCSTYMLCNVSAKTVFRVHLVLTVVANSSAAFDKLSRRGIAMSAGSCQRIADLTRQWVLMQRD